MKKKLFVCLFIILLIVIGISKVEAATYQGSIYNVFHPNSGFSVFGAESNGWMDYNSWIIKSTKDNRIYYCIDPALSLDESFGSYEYITGRENMIGQARLTEAKYKKVQLLAYYGYGYKDDNYDHTDKKWYGITTVMIWRVMRPDLVWTFKTSRNGTPSNSNFKKEKLIILYVIQYSI